MRRRELEQAIRAASRVARETEFLLLGSQAVHAFCQRPPAEILLSQECDIYPQNRPQAAILIHRELGRGSPFARRHGFHVDVVAPELVTLPPGWQRRLKPLYVGEITVNCLDLADLIVSKLAAGRLKDMEFVGALHQSDLCNFQDVRSRIRRIPLARDRERIRSRLRMALEDLP